MQDVTILILTKNEEVNLKDCLESVKGFAKRCVVVDSFSTDRTKEISQQHGADFYEHKFENYARQFNWGLDNTDINTKWVGAWMLTSVLRQNCVLNWNSK